MAYKAHLLQKWCCY